MMTNISHLPMIITIAERAIEHDFLDSVARENEGVLKLAYREWKSERGIDHIERGTADWDAMMVDTREAYKASELSKRNAVNAKRRLKTSILAYQRAKQ